MKADFQFDAPGANPFAGVIAARANPQTGSDGSGISQPPFAVGTILRGRFKSEFCLVQLTLSATTTLLNGAAVQWDKDYNASLLTTANGVQGYDLGHLQFQALNVPAGTYYVWAMQAGNGAVQMTGVANSTIPETTATTGVLNFPASANTAGSKAVIAEASYMASKAITVNTTNGSAVLSGVSNADLNDLNVGATITGAGIPAGSVIAAINTVNGVNSVNLTNGVGGAAATATATATGVTATTAGVLTASIKWPYVGKTN